MCDAEKPLTVLPKLFAAERTLDGCRSVRVAADMAPSEIPRSATAVSPSARVARIVTLLVAGTFFMELLDGTVIVTALPAIARSFHTSPIALNLGMTAYLVALAVFIPISGWVANRFGSRTVFASAIGVFTLASLLCGFSHGLWGFIAARRWCRSAG